MHACVACACVGKLYWCAHTLNVPIKLQWFNVEALTSFLLVYQSCSQRHTCLRCCSRYVVALDSRSSSSNRARRSRSSSNRERRSSSNRAQRCSSNGAKEQQREGAAARTSSSANEQQRERAAARTSSSANEQQREGAKE